MSEATSAGQSKDAAIAVVGFGKMGLLHAGLAGALPGARLAAVAEPSRIIRTALGSMITDVDIVSDYKKLISKSNIDAVVIATPPDTHVEIAGSCVDAGLPFFMEKPIAPTAGAAAALVAKLAQKPTANMVGYMERYSFTFEKAKEIIETGVLGTLRLGRATMYSSQVFGAGQGWRYKKESSGGGALITQGCHPVDLLLWYLGEATSVFGRCKSLFSEEVEDSAHAYLEFRSGVIGYLDVCWSVHNFRKPTLSIHVEGCNGMLDVDADGVKVFLSEPEGQFDAGWHDWRSPDLFHGVAFDLGGEHYSRQMTDFFAAVHGRGTIRTDVRSAYRTQCVIDAIYKSDQLGGAQVKLTSYPNGDHD